MKPIYLIDSLGNKPHKISESKEPKEIGRNPNCYLVTPSTDRTISRVQAEIRYTANQITIRQISEKSETYVGTKENPLEIKLSHSNKTPEPLAIGNIITMGGCNYQIEIKSYKEINPELKKEIKEQLDETIKAESIEP